MQKLHVLASTLNDYDTNSDAYNADPDLHAMRSKIRQGFFEVLGSLKIFNKVSFGGREYILL